MEFEDAIQLFENYNIWLVILGIGFLTTTYFPRLLSKYPFSLPIVLVGLGFLAIKLPLGMEMPHSEKEGEFVEHITELGVIIALMGAGLKIDRSFSWKGWNGTWRLLGITMIITIGLCFFLGLWMAAFAPATAMLLGAVLAPTDPVLASEVQVGAPMQGSENKETEETDKTTFGEEDEVRFSLTSEAGLNDGLAFPFTNMAILMAAVGANPSNWIGVWLQVHVLYELAVAVIIGLLMGYILARVIFFIPAENTLAKAMIGLAALASTLLIYGVTEVFGGYGFIATFIGALVIRGYEREHYYYISLHSLTEQIERILTVVILIGFGAAVADGLLAPLTWELVLCAVLIVFIVRPVAGMLSLIGFDRVLWRERLAISFFGMRGIGSLFYLAYALNEENFAGADKLWALVGLVILISMIVHGITATPVIQKLDKLREEYNTSRG